MTPVEAKRPDARRFRLKNFGTGFQTLSVISYQLSVIIESNMMTVDCFTVDCFTVARPCEIFTRFPLLLAAFQKNASSTQAF
jgi:hypothetical protein